MPTDADDQQHLEAALAHAVRGDRAAAGAELAHIYTQSIDHMFRLWQALADTAVHPIRNRTGGVFALKLFDGNGPADIDRLDPALRLALRFLVAQANQDVDTTRALFQGPLEAGETRLLADVLPLLLDAATESARAQIAARQGTFGSGR